MLLANFNRKEHLRHRAVSLRQHGFLVISDVRTSLKQNTETVLGLFQPHYSRVENNANEAETV